MPDASKLCALLIALTLVTACRGPREEEQVVDPTSLEQDGRSFSSFMSDLGSTDLMTQTTAINALAGFGVPAVGPLRESLGGSDVITVLSATRALGLMRVPAVAALPELTSNLTHSHPQVRAASAATIATLKGEARPSEVAVRAALSDSDWNARYQAATALGAMGTPTGYTKECLECMAHHDLDPRLRTAALTALGGKLSSGPHVCPDPTVVPEVGR